MMSSGTVASSHKNTAGFSPNDLASTRMWFDASASSTVTITSGKVSAWANKASTSPGPDFSNPVSTERPTSGTTQINGRNVILFGGAGALYTSSSVQLLTAGTFTAFSVIRTGILNTSQGQSIIDQDIESGTRMPQMQLVHSSFSTTRVTPSIVSDSTSLTPVESAVYIFVTIYRTNSMEVYVNGVTNGATTVAAPASTVAAPLYVGGHRSGSIQQRFYGEVGEVIVCNEALSSADVNTTCAYLSDKWGVPWSPVS